MFSQLRAIPRSVQSVTRRGFATSNEAPMMWKLAHGIFDPEVSMAEKLPGIPDPVEKEPSTPGPVEVSSLPNGVKVATQDMGGQVSSIGLFVGAGSRHENVVTSGVSHLMEHLAFKGSSERSKYRMVRDMERTGAVFSSSASREVITYNAEGLREKVPDMVDILSETATRPIAIGMESETVEWDAAVEEIGEQTKVMKELLKNLSSDVPGVVMEAMHGAAFHGNTLGLPLVASKDRLDIITPYNVQVFHEENFNPDRMVLSGCNVDHTTLVEAAEKSLGFMSGSSPSSQQEARYTGGSTKIAEMGPAHVAIGFKGVSWRDDDLVAACVLHQLLGGGGSFSSGGPGKGMYTRLYSEILNKHGWVTSAQAFNLSYGDAGVFGIHGSCDPSLANNLVEVLGVQVGKLAGPLAPGELDRAKAMTKSGLIMNLESRRVVCEDIGRQVLISGSYEGPAELSKKIAAITEDDVRNVARKMLSSAPAVVTYGEQFETYEYGAIASSIKAQAQIGK